MMDNNMMRELEIINQKLDLMNQALADLFEQLAALDDEDGEQLFYNERDQSKPL